MLQKGQTVWVLTQDENSEETFYTQCYFDCIFENEYYVSTVNPLVDSSYKIKVLRNEISVFQPLEIGTKIKVTGYFYTGYQYTGYNELIYKTKFNLKSLDFIITNFEIVKFKPVYTITYEKLTGLFDEFIINHKNIEIVKPILIKSKNLLNEILETINNSSEKTKYSIDEKYLIEKNIKSNLPIISFDEYFMGVALLSEMRSKDPNTRVGACIVKDKKIIGIGYNGFPNGCDDKEYPWGKINANPLDNKYAYVVHAELNSILNSNGSLVGSTLYCSLYPCNECAKAIIQAGIKEVVYNSFVENLATKRMFESANIKVRLFENNRLFLV